MIALIATLCLAAPPPHVLQHQQALKAHGAHRYHQAIALWLEADRAQPTWKYGLNLAKAYCSLTEFERCWHWCQVAADRGLDRASEADRSYHADMVTRAERHLEPHWALLQLELRPDLADRMTVRLDGAPWKAPRRR